MAQPVKARFTTKISKYQRINIREMQIQTSLRLEWLRLKNKHMAADVGTAMRNREY